MNERNPQDEAPASSDTLGPDSELQKRLTLSAASRHPLLTPGYPSRHLLDPTSGLMAFRVREVLLVASEYDSFVLEEDGQLAESLDVEFYQLKLSWAPRITTVTTAVEALDLLLHRHFDLVITMTRLGEMDLTEFARQAKRLMPRLPIVLLADNSGDATNIKSRANTGIDQAFVWRGDVSLFLAIVKYVEDQRNVARDIELADVRVIILIENSVRFYSAYLPLLYTQLMQQTNRLMQDGYNTPQRLQRMKARPKILLAETFENGWDLFEKYDEHVLGVITDAKFPREGRPDPHAGIEFVRRMRERDPDMPALVQSSDDSIETGATFHGAAFVNKRSPRLLELVRAFMQQSLGFGDFVFRVADGSEVARVTDLAAMAEALEKVPPQSILYHATRNHFSNWCMARSEFGLASSLRPRRVTDFGDVEALRQHLIDVFKQLGYDSRRGVVVDFSKDRFDAARGFARIGAGSMGGKGRGLGFMQALVNREGAESRFDGCRIVVPPAAVLGAEIFDRFIAENDLNPVALSDNPDHVITAAFKKAVFPQSVREDLRALASGIDYPLAVRSSSLLEDSHEQPFAGVYRTYMLPNNDSTAQARLDRLLDAIKMVYASTFFTGVRAYLRNTPHRMEEEKMAVVLQKVVGRRHGRYYYPDVSGVARSHNHYSVLEMRPEEGIVTAALGLGRTVVDGERAIRFSPRHPNLLPQFSSVEGYLESAQREFYALDLEKMHIDELHGEPSSLVKLGLEVAEEHRTLNRLGSVYSADNDAVHDGISRPGTRLVTLRPLLKSRSFPLCDVLNYLLELAQQGMSCPVEIEFAINLEPPDGGPPEFAVLQVRPMSVEDEGESLSDILPTIERESILCSSTNALGLGRVTGIRDVVYVRPDRFDRNVTIDIANQVGELNDRLFKEERHYLLIGPGRWGTADRWLGIPVDWAQICNARVIIESGMDGVPVTPSEGTHFFQNLTSFGVGYFHVHGVDGSGTNAFASSGSGAALGPGSAGASPTSAGSPVQGSASSRSPENPRESGSASATDTSDFIDLDWLATLPAHCETHYVRHVRLPAPLGVLVDGRARRGLVLKPEAQPNGS